MSRNRNHKYKNKKLINLDISSINEFKKSQEYDFFDIK